MNHKILINFQIIKCTRKNKNNTIKKVIKIQDIIK
jgi:hypothetical protein